MQLIRTTLRLKDNLKKRADRKALEENTSLQAIFNRALEAYLDQQAKHNEKKIVFKTHDLGIPLDNLTRDDFYPEPNI
jgi:hypothetical protein